MKKLVCLVIFTGVGLMVSCAPKHVKLSTYDRDVLALNKKTREALYRVDRFLTRCIVDGDPVKLPPATKIDTLILDEAEQKLEVKFNDHFSYIPFRPQTTDLFYAALRDRLGNRFNLYDVTLYALGQPIEQLVPNIFRRHAGQYDYSRMPVDTTRQQPIVQRINSGWRPSKGLWGAHLAIWPSHGWYYEHKLQRWEWQRARLFQTIEDLLPMSFVVQYLVPMLENAGAYVFLPRERDLQTHEVVIDNDVHGGTAAYREQRVDEHYINFSSSSPGFAPQESYKQGVNPFGLGTARFVRTDTSRTAAFHWIPDFPEDGKYAVYVSYAASDSNVTDAHYSVYHAGGRTEFLVNQRIGGGTWIYLGTFSFTAGSNPKRGSVMLTNESEQIGAIVTADAVRFGGGMGNVMRNGTTSGRPRFTEGARYYMQYAGMPDTLVYNVTEDTNDYVDDYQGRGEWVNYLKGAPFGPNKNRFADGLDIPIDLSLAFHTDAGLAKSDTVVGTLLIYSSKSADTTIHFPDGMSRFANRDFADILQTQIVEDIRAKYDSIWTRRQIWDRNYSEAFRPNVPAALLELLSHQSFLDMKFALDPRFRFDASRSIYKAILKFLAFQYRQEAIVQPLPITHLQAVFNGKGELELSWRASSDPLEPSATAEKFIVYTRIGEGGFDGGELVDQPNHTIAEIEPGTIYSFKVTAVNEGGESLPSEILSAGRTVDPSPPVLIINGFDRIAPATTIETEKYTGFADFWDQGVPDKYDLHYVGRQFNFDIDSPWRDDDAPGHGASYGDLETTVIAGNTFDFPIVHGRSILKAGRSFVSASDEAVMDSLITISDYEIVDLILGEEKATGWPKPKESKQFIAFPPRLQRQLQHYCERGGALFISGSYVGSDLFKDKPEEHPDPQFAQRHLKYFWRTDHAARTGGVVSTHSTFLPAGISFAFNTEFSPDIYAAEAPDAIEPADSSAATILRYTENNMSAGVAYQGDHRVITFGFPFETILNQQDRDKVMAAILSYLRPRESNH